jgi:hypothetical protein
VEQTENVELKATIAIEQARNVESEVKNVVDSNERTMLDSRRIIS